MELKAQLMTGEQMTRALKRISHEIVENNQGCNDVVLLGIRRRGVPLAQELAEDIAGIEGVRVPVGTLDITFYRDDLTEIQDKPVVNSSDIPFDISQKTVVLVDDVLYTGRTARAALDATLKMGRASRIQLAVLVDRGHRELPIRADYVGKNVPTSRNEIISVNVAKYDGQRGVDLYLMD